MPSMKFVRATDEFLTADGELTRTLEFERKDGIHMFFPFPHESMVVVLSPTELYDWYGRPVQLSDEISQVIGHYGSNTITNTETFLVEKTNGKQAIATLEMRHDNRRRTSPLMPEYKQARTGRSIYSIPTLVPNINEFSKIDNSILKTPIMKLLLSTGNMSIDPDEMDFFVGYKHVSSKSQGYSVFTTARDIRTHDEYLTNYFMEKSEDILKASSKTGSNRCNSEYFLIDVAISEDGNKFSGFVETHIRGGRVRPVVTTTDLVRKSIPKDGWRPALYWYYDD